CTSGKSKDGNCKYDRKIDIKRYRLLEKYKHDKDSNNILLKKRFPNGEIDKQKDITHNEKVTKRKNKKSNKSLLNKSQYYTENIDYNNEIFDGKHFHFEKKWIKKRNYYDLIEKKRRFRSISLKIRRMGYLNNVNENLIELIKLIVMLEDVYTIQPYTGIMDLGIHITMTDILFLIRI
ncbi:hypothetical protein PMALA_077220, partial [Plasmodium malariae]